MAMQGNDLKTPVGPTDHAQGPADAAVTIVEYADYQCPYCGRAHEDLKQALAHLKGVRFVFRNFPLMNIHQYAEQAAEAAEAAALQGKFWEMHDILFENQQNLEGDALVAYAEKIGLDVQKFVDDVNAGKTRPKIKADLESGEASGVNGTPAFFINGMRYEGGYTPRELEAVVAEVQRG